MDITQTTTFGELLRTHRLAAELTREALAEQASMSARSIQALERGDSKPHRDTARRLAEALRLRGEARSRFAAPAQVEITVVRAVTSDARIVTAARAGAILQGSRAIEVTHAYGDMRLVVEVAPAPPGYEDTAAALQQAIGQASLARLRASGEQESVVDLRIYIIPPRGQADPSDPVPRIGPVQAATWAIVGRDGHLAARTYTLQEADANATRKNVETLARYRNTLALTNHNPTSVLTGKVAFTLQRLAGDSWQEATPDPASGQIVYSEGECIAFTITNQHTGPVYISMIDFGLSGRIWSVFPRRTGPANSSSPASRSTSGSARRIGSRWACRTDTRARAGSKPSS